MTLGPSPVLCHRDSAEREIVLARHARRERDLSSPSRAWAQSRGLAPTVYPFPSMQWWSWGLVAGSSPPSSNAEQEPSGVECLRRCVALRQRHRDGRPSGTPSAEHENDDNRHRLPRPGEHVRIEGRTTRDAPPRRAAAARAPPAPVLDVDRPKRAGGKGANRRRIGQADGDTSDPERGGRKHSDKQSFITGGPFMSAGRA